MTHPLRKFREAHDNMSQQALGELLGFSKITILRWENGQRKPDPAQVEYISKKTGISPRELRPDLAELIGGA